jgi:hypothetical protein
MYARSLFFSWLELRVLQDPVHNMMTEQKSGRPLPLCIWHLCCYAFMSTWTFMLLCIYVNMRLWTPSFEDTYISFSFISYTQTKLSLIIMYAVLYWMRSTYGVQSYKGICLCADISHSYFMGSKTKKFWQKTKNYSKHNNMKNYINS